MKTWVLIMLWSHFSGGSHTVSVPNLPSEQACHSTAKETINTIKPWNVSYKCIAVEKTAKAA